MTIWGGGDKNSLKLRDVIHGRPLSELSCNAILLAFCKIERKTIKLVNLLLFEDFHLQKKLRVKNNSRKVKIDRSISCVDAEVLKMLLQF